MPRPYILILLSLHLCGRAATFEKTPAALDFSIPSADIRTETCQFANGNKVMTDTNSGPSIDAAAADEAAENSSQADEIAPSTEAIDPTDHARVAAEYKDKLLRVLAEMENLRRRTTREIADTRVYGISAFARDILAVVDNMERALAALDAELREKADAGIKGLLDGVELTERELLKVGHHREGPNRSGLVLAEMTSRLSATVIQNPVRATRTGVSDSSTSAWKLTSVTSLMCSDKGVPLAARCLLASESIAAPIPPAGAPDRVTPRPRSTLRAAGPGSSTSTRAAGPGRRTG
jgi:molecular chaperone GrpE (heat shock protein)